MKELHLPWLELAIVLPLIGAVWLCLFRQTDHIRRQALCFGGVTLLLTLGAWRDFVTLHTYEAHDRWDIVEQLTGTDYLVIDELSAPLIPLAALLYFLTTLATPRSKSQRFSFATALLAESLLLTTLSSREPWLVVALLVAATIPPWFELRRRQRSTRLYVLHMLLFCGLLIAGQALIFSEDPGRLHSTVAVSVLTLAVLVRCGMVPVHCWLTDLFENAGFGMALLTVTPVVGAYAAIRLLLPVAPDWILQSVTTASIVTALYSAGMALVQTSPRRFFAYIFLSQSSLVLVGLETASAVGLTGGLCIWMSVGIAMVGFGLTLRAVEARCGSLSLQEFHGLYEHMPTLAGFFLLTGLAAIGFPGTIGFVAVELLVEAAVHVSSLAGVAVVLATALNGLAVVHAYFRIFTGKHHHTAVDLNIRPTERIAVLVLTILILGGGLWPQPGVSSRYHAAVQAMASRTRQGLHPPQAPPHRPPERPLSTVSTAR